MPSRSRYRNLADKEQLQFAERDAQSIFTALISPEGGNFKAENVKVLKSTNDFWNSRVIEAVENAKFQPGKLGDQAVPMDMKLAVTVLP